MSKHTPGPWHRNIRAGGKYPVIFSGRNTHVAVACGQGSLSGTRPGDIPPDEIEANIDLIAAAPELLASLKKLLSLWDSDIPDQWADAARATVAKAEGRDL